MFSKALLILKINKFKEKLLKNCQDSLLKIEFLVIISWLLIKNKISDVEMAEINVNVYESIQNGVKVLNDLNNVCFVFIYHHSLSKLILKILKIYV